MSLLPMVIINIVKNDTVIDRELINFNFAGILPMVLSSYHAQYSAPTAIALSMRMHKARLPVAKCATSESIANS